MEEFCKEASGFVSDGCRRMNEVFGCNLEQFWSNSDTILGGIFVARPHLGLTSSCDYSHTEDLSIKTTQTIVQGM